MLRLQESWVKRPDDILVKEGQFSDADFLGPFVDFEFSKGMHYYSISASGYLLKSGYFEVDQEYNSESVMAIELELQAQYNSNDNKISSWLIVAIIAFLALNVFFTLLYVFRKE